MQIYIKNMNIVNFLLAVRRKLHLSPMQKVLRQLRKREVNLRDLDALEIYGGSGCSHTLDYASKVRTLEAWEINPKLAEKLKQNIPETEVKITDSYKEIKATSHGYNLIVVDNPSIVFDDHCEHFELFPDIFRIAKNSCILIVNVVPKFDKEALRMYPSFFSEKQLVCRKLFYKTQSPQEVSFDEMVQTYKSLVITNGFNLEWHFFQKRNYVYYLVLKIKKS